MRTEEQVVAMLPSETQFGQEKQQIQPLTITKQGLWRDKMISIMEPILEKFRAEDTPRSFAEAYGTAVRNAPELFSELVAEYMGLDAQKVKDAASPEQVSHAFMLILEMAYPFARPLETVTRLTAK